MLTIFTTCKPFEGHTGVIQTNALASWKALGPEVEVIVVGDDAGVAEVTYRMGLRHIPTMDRHQGRYPYLNSVFQQAEHAASNDLVCYSNADIILSPSFLTAARQLRSSLTQPFLMVGRRTDVEVPDLVDFSQPDARRSLSERAVREGVLRPANWIDYFVFSRGMYGAFPPFIMPLFYYDNWLIWRALDVGARVVDATAEVLAIHQAHGDPIRPVEYRNRPEHSVNLRLAGGPGHVYRIDDATDVLKNGVLRTNKWRRARRWGRWGRERYEELLERGLPFRQRFGLRRSGWQR